MAISFATGTISGGVLQVYFSASQDDATFTWYSGPLVATGATGQSTTLSLVASEAAAQAAAITVAANTAYRFDLPAVIEARFVTIYHRNTTAGYRIDESYARRRLITDDLDAECIRSINVAAGQITADHISVGQLSAIAADMGSITAGTITGALIRTAASGQRVVLDTAGIASYDSGGSQVAGISSADGSVSIIAPATAATWERSYGFTFSGDTLGGVQGYGGSGDGSVMLQCEQRSGANAPASVNSIADNNKLSTASLLAYNGVGLATRASVAAYSRFNDGSAHDSSIILFADTVTINTAGGAAVFGAAGLTAGGGLNLGSAVGAAAGTIRASGYTAGSILFQGTSDQVQQDNANLFWDNTNNKLFIGTNVQGNGIGKLVVRGTDTTAAGPHMEFLTDADDYPLIQVLGFFHDNLELSFDAYLNASLVWKSGDAGSNFQIRKNGDKFGFWYASGVAQGATVTWLEGLTMAATGIVTGQKALVSASGGIQSSGTTAGFTFDDVTTASIWRWYGSTTARLFTGAADVLTITTGGVLDLVGAGRSLRVNGTKVVDARQAGWTAPTATLSRTAVANADTLATTISHLAALITDLESHGLIGA